MYGALIGLTLLGLAWGALAFGAVYEWAYWPLIASLALVGALGLWRARREATGLQLPRALMVALAALCFVTSLQLVPLPRPVLASLSPATDRFLRQYELSYPTRALTHALSITPSATRVGLACLVALSLFLLGLAAILSRTGARPLALGILAIGLFLALVGIVQQPLYAGKIYGFWQPEQVGSPFGPFVNRHHFAGWMVMGASLGVGYLCAGLTHAMEGIKREWRARLLWFSSAEANMLVIACFSLAAMALSLVMTLSRSGIASLTFVLVVAASLAGRRLAGVSRRTLGAGYLALVLLVSLGWPGVDAVAHRFSASSWETLNGRASAWQDTVRLIHDFPLIGTGLNSFGTAMLLYQTSKVDANHFAQAHNDYLQLAAEGGALFALPIVLAVGVFAKTVRRRFQEPSDESTYWIRVGAVIGIVAIALQELVEFSLQMPGNAALFCALAAVAIHRAPPPRSLHDRAPCLPRAKLEDAASGKRSSV